MVVGCLQATALSIQLGVLCLQTVCFFVSPNGAGHESQAIKLNYCVGAQSLRG